MTDGVGLWSLITCRAADATPEWGGNSERRWILAIYDVPMKKNNSRDKERVRGQGLCRRIRSLSLWGDDSIIADRKKGVRIRVICRICQGQ